MHCIDSYSFKSVNWASLQKVNIQKPTENSLADFFLNQHILRFNTKPKDDVVQLVSSLGNVASKSGCT